MKNLSIFFILLIGLSSLSTGFVWDNQTPDPSTTPSSSYVWDNTTTLPTPAPITIVTTTSVPISTSMSPDIISIIPTEFSMTNIIILIVVILIIIVIFIELWLRRLR